MQVRNDLVDSLPCWVEVDLDRIADNVRSLDRWVGSRTAVSAVVKAQGYGLGAEEVARAALAAGASSLSVARVHEGVELRAAGIKAPILVLSRTDFREVELVAQHDLAVTVDSTDLAVALGAAARSSGREVAVHLKIDTGLHRFGVDPERSQRVARTLFETPGLRPEGLWTHFASADEPELAPVYEQFRLFRRVVGELEDAGCSFPLHHAANSAATFAVRDSHMSMVRVGQSLYGVHPLPHGGPGPELRAALALKARVGRVMDLEPGDVVGYGRTWRAQRQTRAAMLMIGYADGLPRSLSNQGVVLIEGREAPLLGRVSMDHAVADVTEIPGVTVGSEVVVFGRDNGFELDLWRVARDAQTIPHVLLTGIGGRVPRVYYQDGEVVRVARTNGSVGLS